jgi:capsular exopolysaccharide synthesis family protein
VHRGPDERIVRAQAPFRVEKETGWTGVREVLGMCRRHIWLIAIFSTIGVAIAAWQASKVVPQYSANAIIRLVNRQPSVSSGRVAEMPLGMVDPVLNELVVLTGRTVLGQAVDREGFRLFSPVTRTPAGFVEAAKVSLPPDRFGTIHLDFEENHVVYGPVEDRRTAAYGEPILLEGATFVIPEPPAEKSATLNVVPRDVAIDYLTSGISTELIPSTGGIQVAFTTTEKRIAPRAVNAVVEEYQKVNAEMAQQNVGRRRAFLEEQLRTTDSLLMVAQTGLSTLRSQTQAYSASGRFTAEQGNLMQVEIQQAQLQAELRIFENTVDRIMQARGAGQPVDFSAIMTLPGVGADPVIGQLYTQLVGFRSERETMLAGEWARAPTHPDVQRLDILIASTEERLVNAMQSHVNSLRAQVGALGGLRGRALANMSTLPRTEVQEVYLTSNLEALQMMGDQLRDQYQEVRLEEAAEAGLVEIVQLSTRALAGSSNTWIMLLLGLAVGLMVGSGAAVAREMFDDSIRSPQEIEEILLVPNLAVIPESSPHLIEAGSNGGGRRAGGLDSAGTEAYRILRTNLLFSQHGLKTLVVTSAAPGEGKTMTSVNLAAAYARQGIRVLLLECDLRRPSLGKYFENTKETDLADILYENRDWRQAIQPTKISGLDVLLAGRSVPRASEFLGGNEMKRLLEELAREYDMIILDTSPLLVAADATVLGAIVDGVLLVVRATRTDRGAVEQAVHQLGLVGANVVGTVLNDPEGAASRYGHYYDYSTEYEVQ